MFSREVIYFAVNGRNYPGADYIAPFITDLGDGWTTIAIAIILALLNYRKAFVVAGGYALTSLIAQLIKHLVNAPRPKLYFQTHLNQIHFVKGMYVDTFHSFPSGHTVTAFSTALMLAYFLKHKAWSVLLLIAAVFVGYSRMYLSEHFFEDVTAGSMIGVFLTIWWLWFIDNKSFLHSPKWSRGLLNRKNT